MVLILTENEDQSTNIVIDWLNYFGIKWIRINETDSISFSKLLYKNNNLEEFVILVNGVQYDLTSISSYWYRRGFLNFDQLRLKERVVSDNTVQSFLSNYINEEISNIDSFIHSYLEETKRHINSYINSKNDKTYYHFIAQQCGLSVPDTLISNKKEYLTDFSKDKHNGIISKSINEGFGFTHEYKYYYCTTYLVPEDDIKNSTAIFFPTLFQENVSKFIELRIFYINQSIYSMAIFSQRNNKTKLDYRNYDSELPNRRVPFILPDDIQTKIIKFMKRINLNCGSLDMILNTKGEYQFLEVNPIGQFGMVSFPCNYFLEKEIAEFLYGKM